MTVFTLNAGELWGGRGADKSGRKPETNGMAGKAGRVILAAGNDKGRVGERTGMGRVGFKTANTQMAFETYLRPGVLGTRSGDAKKRIAVKLGDGGCPEEIRIFTQGEPRRVQAVAPLKDLIITDRKSVV